MCHATIPSFQHLFAYMHSYVVCIYMLYAYAACVCILTKNNIYTYECTHEKQKRKETDSIIGLMQANALSICLTCFWYFPLHSPLLRESWLVSVVSLR